MATRSNISVVLDDGSVKSIYCHFDGYMAHNGMKLHKFYNQYNLARDLVELGDMSYLGEFMYPAANTLHTFENPVKEVCVFYGRDRGTRGVNCITYDDLEWYCLSNDWQEYNYLFKDNEWFLVDKENKELTPLSKFFPKDKPEDCSDWFDFQG